MSQRKVDWKNINFPLTLAPMVGISHVALREILHMYLPQETLTLWPTEMLNSRKLPRENFETTPETQKLPEEHYLVPQILGNEEKPIFESIQKLKIWGAHGIDINMGCPVKKALKHNYGVALMGDRKYAQSVVRMAVQSSDLPVSVKLRAVESENSIEDLYSFVCGLVDSGASWICLHPRTATQKRRGKADWEQIRFLKSKISIPIIGNGDVQTCEDVFAMKKETHCDLVMAGRALAARPWMLWQVGEILGMKTPQNKLINDRKKAPKTKEEEGSEYGKCLLLMIDLAEKYFDSHSSDSQLVSANLAMRKIAFYVRITSPWLEFGHSLVSLVSKSKNTQELRQSITHFFSIPQSMNPKTELKQ